MGYFSRSTLLVFNLFVYDRRVVTSDTVLIPGTLG